ncbi:MAG: hypothetical protein ACKVP5_11110 [Aestuariivirga sp.]
MKISHICLVVPLAALNASPAYATGGLGCTIDDANLTLNVDTAVSRGMGGVFLNLKAEAVIKAKEAPEPLRKLTLDSALVHHWYTNREIKLAFYKETETGEHASVDITIETTMPEGADEDAEYVGTYELSIFAAGANSDSTSTVLNGKASCSAGG